MAKEATLQVRMDAELKEKVELLYRGMGTSFAEAVRIFATQSLVENRMPFQVTTGKGNAFGAASKYANAVLINQEKGAFAQAMEAKHAAD